MAVQASQLIARVSTEGVDTAKSQLQGMGQAARDASSSVGEGGLFGAVTGAIGGIVDFGAQVGMTIFGLQNLASGAVSLAQNLLEPAESAETMNSAFTTLLGSQKAAIDEMARLDQFASKTPFTTLDIDKAGSELIAFKTNASDVVPELTAIGDELGSVGRGTAANMDSIVNIFGKIRTEGKLTIGTMSELSINGIDAWTALEKSTGKTQAQLTQMISAGLIPASDAIDDLTKGIEANPLYAGGMARQSNTMTGLISTLKSNWDQMLASFGSPILKGLEPIIGNLGNMLSSSAFKDFAGSVGQGIVNAFDGMGNAASHVGDIFKSLNISGFTSAVKNSAIEAYNWAASGHAIHDIVTALQPAIAYLSPKFKELGEAFAHLKEVSMPLVRDLEQLGISFEKSGVGGKILRDIAVGIVGAIGGLVDGTRLLVTGLSDVVKWFTTGGSNAKWLWDLFKDIGTFLATTFTPVWKQLVTVFETQIKPAVDNMINAFKPAMPLFQLLGLLIGGVLVGAIRSAIEGIAGLITGLAQAIGGIVQIFAGIFQTIGGIISFFVDLFTGHFSNLKNDINNILGGILTIIVGIWQTISGVFMAAFDFIQGLLDGFVKGFIGFFKFLYDELIGHSIIPDIVNGMVKWFQDALNIITGFFGGIGQWFQDRFTEAYNGIKNALGAVGGWVNDNLVKPFEDGLGRIGGVFQAIAKLIQDATSANWTAIPGDLHSLGIPGFASGTDFAPGGFAQLAEHGAELITSPSVGYLPRGAHVYSASQTAQMMSGGYGASSGGGQPVVFQVDGQTFARIILPHVVGQVRNQVGIWGM